MLRQEAWPAGWAARSPPTTWWPALDEAAAQRGVPEYIRCDKGPELIAAIRDWCRFMGTNTAYIEPGSPWENPFVESFNGKLRDEFFAREIFDTVMEARALERPTTPGIKWDDIKQRSGTSTT